MKPSDIELTSVSKNFEFEKSPDAKKWGGNGELVVANPLTFKVPTSGVVSVETDES